MGLSGLEPPTLRLSGVRSNHLSYEPISIRVAFVLISSPFGGDEEDRTPDPLRARQVLSQLSYTPISGFRICRSYLHLRFFLKTLKIEQHHKFKKSSLCFKTENQPVDSPDVKRQFYVSDRIKPSSWTVLLRKEVIQPHLPIRLPCYDFTPVINPTFDSALLAVRLLASGVTDSHGVTGGVYKARERIHRGMLIRDY